MSWITQEKFNTEIKLIIYSVKGQRWVLSSSVFNVSLFTIISLFCVNLTPHFLSVILFELLQVWLYPFFLYYGLSYYKSDSILSFCNMI